MSPLRRCLVVVGCMAGLMFAVPLLAAFQGPVPTGLPDLLAKLGPDVLLIVLGAMGLTWIRKQERGAPANDAIVTELKGINTKLETFLLSQARIEEPRTRAFAQIEAIPAALAVVRGDLAEHERLAVERAVAHEDAAAERDEQMTRAILEVTRLNTQRGVA